MGGLIRMLSNKSGSASLIIRISLIGAAVLGAVMIIGWLYFRPVQVPAGAVNLELSGYGRITISSSGLYDISGDKAKSLGRRVTIDVAGSRMLKVKGTAAFKVSGDVVVTVGDKTRIEPPNRQGFAFTVTDDGSVSVASILPVHFRVSNCKKLTANDLVKVTAVDCEQVEAFGKSDVFVQGAKLVTANTWSHVEADRCDKVVANDKSRVDAKNSGEVIAGGTSQVTA